MFPFSTKRGFIQWLVLIVLIVLSLSILGFDLRELSQDETVQGNFGYVTEFTVTVWNDYLKKPATFVLERIIAPIWELFTEGLENLQNETFNPSEDELPTAPGQ